MSGLVGLFRRSGEAASPDELETMTETLSHRGPHGRGTWREGPVGLGHQQLRTTPEARHAALPERSDDGNCVLTMDARVDNRRELCDALGITEAPTLTDARILLDAYDEWGVDCFERVVGTFAVAIWDRDRNRLVCARDHAGIKPFCYALRDDLFAFGSEPKAILSLPSVSGGVDDRSVFAFLADELDDPEATFFESIARLPPATVMVVEPDSARKRTYWSLNPDYELDLPSDEAYERRFREVFTEAVRCRLRRPLETAAGAYLSGGLDSTSICCVAQSMLGRNESLRTFSVTHEEYPTADETEYLEAALKAYDFDSRVVDGSGATPFRNLDARLAHHDEPFYPPLFMMMQQFTSEIAADGCRVILDGLGGDQTLHYGGSYLTELLTDGRLAHFLGELDAYSDVRGRSRKGLLFERAVRPLTPTPLRRAWRELWVDDDGLDPLIERRMAEKVGFPSESDDNRLDTHHREDHRDSLADPEQVYFFEVTDVELARFGVEPRYPFRDRRLIEYCLSLPVDQKVRNGVGRQIARRGLRDVLPPEVRTRTDKADFIESWVDGLYEHELDCLEERLVESPEFVTKYLDEAELRAAYRRFAEDPSYRDAWPIIKAYTIETWFRSMAEVEKGLLESP